jgi:hypothetical protein
MFVNDEDELVMAVTCLVCGNVSEYFDLGEKERSELIATVMVNGAAT